MKALFTTLMGIIAPATVYAAAGPADESGILVWVFLGFFALIVVSQIVPAILLLTGMVKGVASVIKEEMAPAHTKK